jgi:cyclopropane-fatty-acyl-phospholipid synthase
VTIADRSTLLKLLWNPEMAFGDGWSAGMIGVRGDLVELLKAIYRTPRFQSTRRWYTRFSNTRRRALRRVHHHYDLGNDFYRRWLDREMVYTCAYFPSPDMTLEEAQVAKMDHVCRKLGLRAGDRVVEAGCGWGALALHMAQRYGATVRAYNISSEQIRHARERARERGLDDRVEFVQADYRAIDGEHDVFVSVGMLEHVGLENYAALGDVIDRTLERRRGRGLLHFIGRNVAQPLSAWIDRRIFPGAHPPTLGEATRGVLEPAGLAVIDVENLRGHYAKTLDHWRRRFDDVAADLAPSYGQSFVSAWRLYLAGSQAGFEAGTMQLFQVLFARNGSEDLVWTTRSRYPQATA